MKVWDTTLVVYVSGTGSHLSQQLVGLWQKKNAMKMDAKQALKRLKSIPVTVDWAVVQSYQPNVPSNIPSNLGQDRVDLYVAKLVSTGQLNIPVNAPLAVRVLAITMCAVTKLTSCFRRPSSSKRLGTKKDPSRWTYAHKSTQDLHFPVLRQLPRNINLIALPSWVTIRPEIARPQSSPSSATLSWCSRPMSQGPRSRRLRLLDSLGSPL